MRLRDVALAAIVNVLWGVNFAAIDLGLAHLPPLLFCALRFGAAAVPAIFFVGRTRVAWRWVVAVAVSLGVVKFGLLFAGMAAGMPAGLSALVLQSQAVFTMIFAFALLRERPTARQVVGLAIAAGGIAVVAAGVVVGGTGAAGAFGLVLAAGAAWGLANLAMRRAAARSPTAGGGNGGGGGWDAVRFMVWVSAVAAPTDLALSLLIEGPRRDLAALSHLGLVATFAIGYVAWVATLLGFGIWGALLRRYRAASVAPFSMLAPVCAIGAGAVLLGQPVHRTDLLGGALVVAGVLTGLLPGGRVAPVPEPVAAPVRVPTAAG
ncbi:MAG: O-acetylserine/cysteine efflux transporter [Micromonosporaceae bacterium]